MGPPFEQLSQKEVCGYTRGERNRRSRIQAVCVVALDRSRPRCVLWNDGALPVGACCYSRMFGITSHFRFPRYFPQVISAILPEDCRKLRSANLFLRCFDCCPLEVVSVHANWRPIGRTARTSSSLVVRYTENQVEN